jgi:hypothetical protein
LQSVVFGPARQLQRTILHLPPMERITLCCFPDIPSVTPPPYLLVGAAHDDLERVVGQGRFNAFVPSVCL